MEERNKNFTILKLSFFILPFIIWLFISKSFVFASEYVLPYPSYMPNHKLYKIRQLVEKLTQYYYFGNLSQYKYYLKTADKYLVEAKTLFEYRQYRLAIISLERSDDYFNKAGLSLLSAAQEGKKIDQQTETLSAAKEKHLSVLEGLLNSEPETMSWHEENQPEIVLDLKSSLTISKKQREIVGSLIN